MYQKPERIIYGIEYINDFLIFRDFQLIQSTINLDDNCKLEAQEINQQSNNKICLFRSLTSNLTDEQQNKNDRKNEKSKRILATANRIHGNSMQSLIRDLSANEFEYTIEDAQASNFLVIGYFRFSQTYTKNIQLMSIGVLPEFYIFLNLLITSNTQIYFRYFQHSSNGYQVTTQNILSKMSYWMGIGIGYSHSLQKAKLVQMDANQQVVQSAQINASLPSFYKSLKLCIACSIPGGKFDKFTGMVSSVKIIYGISGFTIPAGWYFYNENISTSKSLILSSSFNPSTFIPGSEYDIGQSFVCSAGYGYIDGACILNCQYTYEDPYSVFNNALYYDSVTQKCKYCMNDCTSCTSLTQCTACRQGYSNNNAQHKCVKCESESGCVSSCTGSQVFDQMNQICIDNFDSSIHQLSPILLSSRIFVETNDFLITPPLTPDQYITHCYFNVSINFLTLNSFLGGTSFTQSSTVTKSWSNLPKGYIKKIKFYALLQGNQLPTQFQVKVNQRLADLKLDYQTLVDNQISCSQSGTSTQSIYNVEYSIVDSQNKLDLEISCLQSGWAIRNVSIEIVKCHPTCNTCYLGDDDISYCATCKSDMVQNKFQCNCQAEYFAQYDNSCYESPCVSCVKCSSFQPNCKKCEDLTGKCILCENNYIVNDGSCILNTACTNKDEIFFNNCGVRKENGFSFFFNNTISRYFDYWILSQDIYSTSSCLGKNWVPILKNRNYHKLNINMPMYYDYHYKLSYSFNFLFMDSLDSDDKIELYDGTTKIFTISKSIYKRTDPTSYESCGVSSPDTNFYTENDYPGTFTQVKTNNSLQFKFLSVANTDDEGQSFASMKVDYERCNPMCAKCTGSTEGDCTKCIDNATFDGASKCVCISGFYFTLERNFQGQQNGKCLKCDKSCKTCDGPQFSDCKTCADGYTALNGLCNFNCLDGYFWDSISSSCKACHGCCRLCNSSDNQSCVDCKQNYVLDSKLKQCKHIVTNSYCEMCSSLSNGFCGGDELSQSVCIGLGWAPTNFGVCIICKNFVNSQCAGDLSTDAQNACIAAGYLDINATECSSCFSPNSNPKLCGANSIVQRCDNLYWVRNSPTTCINCSNNSPDLNKCTCDPTCATCDRFHTDTACLSCSAPRVLFNKMCLTNCPNGYKANGTVCEPCQPEQMKQCQQCFPSCSICDPFQISQNSNTCTSCSSTRKYDSITKECECQDGVDTRKILFECSYQDIAVIEPQLDNIEAKLFINFGRKLQIPSSQLCSDLFKPETLTLLGATANCSINNNYVVVELSDDSMIIEGNLIYFKDDILSFDSTPSIIITKFYNMFVTQKPLIEVPQVIFDYPTNPSSCDDIQVTFKSLEHTGSRGFFSYSWSLASPSPNSDAQMVILNDLITQLNTNQKLDFLIPQGIIYPDVQVIIKLDYKLKVNIVSSHLLQITPIIVKKIIISVSSTLISPILRQMEGMLSISISVLRCFPQDTFDTEPVKLDVTSTEYPAINFSDSNYSKNEYIMEIQSYTLPIQIINIDIKASLVSDSFIETKSSYILNVQSSDLYVKIIGGNGFFSYKSKVSIFGKFRDFDLQTASEPQGIDITWKCIDQIAQSQCVGKNSNPVTFPAQLDSATFYENTFNPYTIVSLVLEGSKQTRTAKSQIIILFSELDIPPLGVQMYVIDPLLKTVNLNEEIYVELIYTSSVSVDLLSYSATIIYEDNVVGLIKFDYFKLRFQIWNYFSGFNRGKSEFQIRFSIFNPLYFVPSMTLMNLELNFPPQYCVFDISSDASGLGYSLETQYKLQMKGCQDENGKIVYQFFYYTSADDFEYEKKFLKQVKRRQITDIQNSNEVKIALPAGKLLLMAQAIDQKQAIFNSTLPLEVQKKLYDESQYLSIVQSKLNLVASSTPTTSIFELSILSDDILLRTEFKTSSALNIKKLEIKTALIFLSKQLSPLSTFNTLADKAISVLVSSGMIQTSTESVSLLTEAIELLDFYSNLQQSNLLLSKLKLNQKLYDYFLLFDWLCDPLISSQTVVNDQLSQNKLIELHDKIGTYLFKNTLPNEDPIIFKGTSSKVLSSQVTEKYVCSYFMCDISGDTRRLLVEQSNIFNIKMLQTDPNLYKNDITYQNYIGQLKKQNAQINISTFPVITPSIKNEINEELSSFTKNNALYYKSNSQSISKNMTCITRSSIGWTKKGCKNVFKSDTQQYICICENLSPTTVIDDLQDLFTNSNLNVAFGEEGLSNLANFSNFYEYIAFWLLLGFTIGLIVLYFQGKLLDLLSSQSQPKIEQDIPLLLSSGKSFSTPKTPKNKILPFNSMQIQQMQGNDDDLQEKKPEKNKSLEVIDLEGQITGQVQENNGFKFQSNGLGNQETTQAMQIQIKSSSVQDQRVSSQISDEQLFNRNNQINDSKSPEMKSEQKKDLNDEDQIKQEEDNQQKDENQAQDDAHREQILDHYFQNFKKQPKYKQIFIFHNFVSIFLIYNPTIPRPLRFLVFYVRLIHSLAISVIFDQNYSLVQRVILSIVNALTIIVVVKLLEKSFVLKSKVGMIFSRFINLAILGTYYYVILSIISGISSSDSNLFIGTFGLVISIDLFVISTISAILQKQIAMFILKNKKATGIFYYAYKAIELQIVLMSVS